MSIFPQGFKHWHAIEADTRRLTFAEAGELRLGDPLYLLSKQWCMGEFRHVQGGLPIRAEAGIVEVPLTSMTDGRGVTETLAPGSRSEEVLAEPPAAAREESSGRNRLRLGLSFGRHAGRAIRRAPDQKAALQEIEKRFSTGADSGRLCRLRARSGASAVDGAALLTAVRKRDPKLSRSALWPVLVEWFREETGGAPPPPEDDRPTKDDRPAVEVKRLRLDEWFPERFLRERLPRVWPFPRPLPLPLPFPQPAEPVSGEADLFEPDSFSHTGEVAFGEPAEEIRLSVQGSMDGTLDWTMLEGSPEWPDVEPRHDWVVPTRLSFPGKPEERLWTLAETTADWTAASAGPSDLSRMVLGTLIAEQTSDWTLLPLTVARGAAVRVASLWMFDSFGRSTMIHAAGPKHLRLWAGAGDQAADAVFTMAEPDPLQGPAVERTALRPDDHDNRLWLVERRLPDGDGRGRDRDESRAPVPAVEQPVYHLQVDPAENWYPLARNADGSYVPAPFVTGSGDVRLPKGRIGAALDAIAHGEVPDEGLAVERVWRMGRDHDGSPIRWIARRRVPAGEPASSGLIYDHLVRPDEE